MANLVSPGVSVTVIDESFYGTSGPGTVPLIVFATAANKASPTGVGIAPGTVPSQANKLFLATSQRELIQTFGNPHFKTVQGTPVHGYELNEYGLHAAYQYLGISNRAYVLRANIDLDQMEPSVTAPRGEPVAGTVWFDLNDTAFGLFKSNGGTSLDPFSKVPVTVYNNVTEFDANTGIPLTTIGSNGDFAVLTAESTNRMFEKIGGVWYQIGSASWKQKHNVVTGSTTATLLTVSNSFSVNGLTFTIANTSVTTTATNFNTWVASQPSLAGKISMSAAGNIASIAFSTDTLVLQDVTGTPLADLKLTAGTTTGVKLSYSAHNRIPQDSVAGDMWIKTTSINNGSKFVVKIYNAVTGTFDTLDAPFYASDSAATAALGTNPQVGTLYVRYNIDGTTQLPVASQTIMRWNGSAWAALSYEASIDAPTTAPEEGTMWFNTHMKVDVMVCNGDQWLGYLNQYPATNPTGVILNSTPPLTQTDDTALVDNDLWLDTNDLENYPALYRYNATTKRWVLIDNTDQTTPYGIVFADARQDSGGEYSGADNSWIRYSEAEVDLLQSDFVDPDAPDPLTYTTGTLLFNTRYSTYNVKKWMPNWLSLGGFDANTDFTEDQYEVGGGLYNGSPIEFGPVAEPGRWVTASGNAVDGSPYMGRKAQRAMIVRELAASISANEDIRSELIYFNLIAAPGYPEMIDEMVTLNTDAKEVAFIIGDTPARLKSSATDIQRWATNASNAASNGDKGLTTMNTYVGMYYPWGLSTNVDGNEVMVPPSTMALRTMAYNDQVSYPWFAPAGFNRGIVTNAASVGYLTDEGEYQPVVLNQGQRDVLYLNKINPIAYIPNRGLVVYGQKTTSPVDSALDRVNVARLTNYLRYNLDNLAKPFLFEQNDQQTRDAFKVTIERFLMGLVGLRALEDFAVICDGTNNTPERRDRNELWADILIQPLKAVEFIYLPIRIRNSGDSLDL